MPPVMKKPVKAAAPMPKKKSLSRVPSHAVTWMALIAVVFSGITLSLAGSAEGATVSVCNQNSIAGLRCLIGQLNTKLDTIIAKLDAQSQACTAAASTSANQTETAASCPDTTNRDQTPTQQIQAPPPATEPAPTQSKTMVAPTQDPVLCKQKCEDEFNACAKLAGQDMQKYATCKNNLYACFTPCGL